jgi:hypothetical protein
MKKFCFALALLSLSISFAPAQTQQQTQPRPTRQIANQDVIDLTQYGVRVQPDQRLIVMMAALEAAGFDSKDNSLFRQQVRKDIEGLDPELRRRMREFFTRSNRGLENATPTDQAARYVSLAYALTNAPDLSEPARSTDLPAGLLEVLDFAPLVREFYRKSGIDSKLLEYTRKYQAVGDLMRPNVARAVNDVALYLNTRPQLVVIERVTTTNQQTTAKKDKKPRLQATEVKERERNFYVVPDLLAVPNSVKFRSIGDNYYAIVGADVQAENSSEFRRAYLQYLVDPFIYKNAKEIALQRDAIRSLLDELTAKKKEEFDNLKKQGRIEATAVFESPVSPDVFLATARSLVVAADAMQLRNRKIEVATFNARREIDKLKTDAEKRKVSDALRAFQATVESDTFAALSEGYENGAVLAFYFADQLRGQETAGFDVGSSFADMVATFDGGKEKSRLRQNETERQQALIALAKRRAEASTQAVTVDDETARIRSSELIAGLNEVEGLLKIKDFEEAEKRLGEMLVKHPGELRVIYAMGRTASQSASTAFDEGLRDERLKKAMTHYQNILQLKNADTPLALLSNTLVALAVIYEFYADERPELKDAALKHFSEAVALGNLPNSSYREAVAGRDRLTKKQ